MWCLTGLKRPIRAQKLFFVREFRNIDRLACTQHRVAFRVLHRTLTLDEIEGILPLLTAQAAFVKPIHKAIRRIARFNHYTMFLRHIFEIIYRVARRILNNILRLHGTSHKHSCRTYAQSSPAQFLTPCKTRLRISLVSVPKYTHATVSSFTRRCS